MEVIVQFLSSLTDSDGTVRWFVIALAAGTVTVFGMGVASLLQSAADPVRRRLGGVQAADASMDESGRKLVSFETLMGPIAKYVAPKDQIENSEIGQKLVYAGFTGPSAQQNFYALRAILFVLLPVTVLLVTRLFADVPVSSIAMYTAIAAGMGFLGPSIVLDRLVERRQKALRNGFPDALDLLVVCVESGLGLSQAISRVADELQVSHPELAIELALVNAEMRAGVDNVVALKNLADRSGMEDIRGLVSTLVQTLRFGTSVADALRVYSEEFRDKRTQAAEERAAKMGTKMIFPLVLFMFPAFFVVAIGPAVIRLVNVFSNL
jgi:tight adherence protein C